MKKRAFLTAIPFVIGIVGAFATKAHYQTGVWYKDSTNPGCLIAAQLPSTCTGLPQSGIVCTTAGPAGGTRTYYKDAACTVPYWKKP